MLGCQLSLDADGWEHRLSETILEEGVAEDRFRHGRCYAIPVSISGCVVIVTVDACGDGRPVLGLVEKYEHAR